MNLRNFLNLLRNHDNEFTQEQLAQLDFPDRIRILIRIAAQHDPGFAVHGAKKHKYQLNPPASLRDVRNFEEKFQIKLPEQFTRFLTEAGNGGAGVDYGIYPLAQIEKENEHLLCKTDGKVILEYENPREEWNRLVRLAENEDELSHKYDAIVGRMLKGLLVIGTEGCTCDHVLICEGKYQGMTATIDWNLQEDFEPYFHHKTFEDWMCDHFTKIAWEDVTKHSTSFWTVNG